MTEEQRIDFAVLVAPYLTGANWLDHQIERDGAIWIPFANTVYYWWFRKISGFPYDRRTIDDFRPLDVRSALIMPNDRLEGKAAAKLIEITPSNVLQIIEYPATDSQMVKTVVDLVNDYPGLDNN